MDGSIDACTLMLSFFLGKCQRCPRWCRCLHEPYCPQSCVIRVYQGLGTRMCWRSIRKWGNATRTTKHPEVRGVRRKRSFVCGPLSDSGDDPKAERAVEVQNASSLGSRACSTRNISSFLSADTRAGRLVGKRAGGHTLCLPLSDRSREKPRNYGSRAH